LKSNVVGRRGGVDRYARGGKGGGESTGGAGAEDWGNNIPEREFPMEVEEVTEERKVAREEEKLKYQKKTRREKELEGARCHGPIAILYIAS